MHSPFLWFHLFEKFILLERVNSYESIFATSVYLYFLSFMTWGIERSVVRKIGTRSIQISRLERIFVDIVLSEKLWWLYFLASQKEICNMVNLKINVRVRHQINQLLHNSCMPSLSRWDFTLQEVFEKHENGLLSIFSSLAKRKKKIKFHHIVLP